ncbi:MAG: argininosuccinate lyase [Gammaproteobacteria bacterium]|nr:argininosuccinate lyase [Gammaproteobacteria bacterium]|tara:strand:- start:3188 stop:4582 length:1395 start_codon:yes stop_codon:yes gene_type:complete
MKNTTWSSRFSKKIDKEVLEFSESVTVDCVLFESDIKVTSAHVSMLSKCNIINKKEEKIIINGLKKLKDLHASGKLKWSISDEDIHMNIEKALTKIIGDLGKKIHLGRSRNDLVSTDLRLYLRDCLDVIIIKLRDLQYALAKSSLVYHSSLFPGYTHLQIAQPVTLGQHLMAWAMMAQRDELRLSDMRISLNTMPLGSAALAGTPHKINREYVAKQLGFDSLSINSMDAVSDRDFVCDIAYCNSMIMMHLSRICEELVIWSNPQFNLIELDESFCTGSSIMPQKKNPDIPELIRGKTGGVFGDLFAVLTMLKGLPLTYNRDLQEDKMLIFDSVEVVLSSLNLMPRLILTMKPNLERAAFVATSNFSAATDIADYLASKNVPFRDAHSIVGGIVKFCEKKSLELNDLTIDQFQKFSPLIKNDIYKILDPNYSIKSKQSKGSTSPKSVLEQAKTLINRLSKHGYKK